MSHFVARVLVLAVAAAVLSAAAFGGVVGSGTPSSCTQAALQAQISAGGTVTFNCGSGPQSIAITSTMFIGPTNPPVTIDGNATITLDGSGITTGMLSIFGSSTALPDVTIKRITFANGNINTGLIAGGAIQNFGRLTLDTVVFTNNRALGSGGGIFQELCTGCLPASITITHSVFQNTSNGGGGAAISVEGGFASVADSTFSGNTASTGGAIEIYGNSTFSIIMTVDRCTFTGNTATFGGAISVESLNAGSSVNITNDTFTGNTVSGANGQGAAIYIDTAPVTITNCTIAGNTSGTSGGALHFGGRKPVTTVINTIVTGNIGGNCSVAPGETFVGGHNLQFGDTTCTGMTVANPLLGPLASNGGPTQTMALGAGSPAIDAGDTVNAPSTDQRGVSRTDGNGDGLIAVDIGAFEAPGVVSGNGNQASRRHRAVKP